MRHTSRTITTTDLKSLWARSGGICAICRKGLSLPGTTGTIGEMAHIVAHSPSGPRSDQTFPQCKLNDYENLILLCPNHHREIDLNVEEWPVQKLKAIKIQSENWVSRRLQADSKASTKCLFVISGASSVGKDVVINRLIHFLEGTGRPAVNLRRFTTRRRRPDERYETPFTYLSEQRFHNLVGLGKIGCVHSSLGYYYGCDPRFSAAAPPGTAIFYSMRVFSFLPHIQHAAETAEVNVRNILLTADERTIRSRILQRSGSPDEKLRRIDKAVEDLPWLDKHRDFVDDFFDLRLENSDMSRLNEVVESVKRFVVDTMDQITELKSWWGAQNKVE